MPGARYLFGGASARAVLAVMMYPSGYVHDVRVVIRAERLTVISPDGMEYATVSRSLVKEINNETLGALARAWLTFFGWEDA